MPNGKTTAPGGQEPVGAPSGKSSKLNAREKLFVAEYLKDFNGTRAAIAAGYSKRSAYELASRLLRKVEIARAISAGQEKRAKKLEVTVDDIANELKLIGFARMGKYAKITERGSVKFTPTDQLIESGEDAAIESYSESVTKDGGSSAIKLHNKIKALELLGKHIGMWKEKVENVEEKNRSDQENWDADMDAIQATMERLEGARQ